MAIAQWRSHNNDNNAAVLNNTITSNRPNPLRWLGSQLPCGGDLPVVVLKMRDFLLKMAKKKGPHMVDRCNFNNAKYALPR
jgi:hypothetical protein